MNRKTLVLSAVVGLLAPVMAGCGGSEGGSGGGAPIVLGTTDRFAASKEAPAPLDPAHTYDTATWNIIRQTIQTLMAVPRGGSEPVPEAASSCGFTDNQNESYRCKLRSGLEFSNGDPLSAEDVKYSIERVINIDDPGSAVGLLANIDTIETNGDREVIFHLKTPDATFPYKLSTPIAGIVNPKMYQPKKLRNGFQVDGSGPYTFKAEVADNKIVKASFTRNPKYKGGFKLQNDKAEIRTFNDSELMGAALNKGDIDVMLRTLTPEQIQDMIAKPKKGIELSEVPGLEIRYLGFDTEAPSVKDKAVRQAMAYIVDRGEIASEVYGAMAQPLYSLVPAGIADHTNSFFNKYGEPNPAKAADLLRDAGIKTPVKLTLNFTTDHYGEATTAEFKMLKKQLDASGLFDVTIKGDEWPKFLPGQTKGEYAVYGLGWFPDFPDPDNFVAPFLDEGNILSTPYVSTEARDLIPKTRQEADRGAAAPAFARIQDIVAEDVPVLPLWQAKQYVAARDDVAGVEWAVNSSSELHLWELGRGTGGTS